MASSPFTQKKTDGTPTQLTFAGDPAVIAAQGSINRALAFAQEQALAQQRQLLIDYGDPQLTQAVLGASPVDVQATKSNQFSVLQRLAHEGKQATTDINEGTNKRNLFYSSTRSKALLEEARRELQNQYSAARSVQSQLAQIAANLERAQLNAEDQKSQAILQALANRTGQVAQGG